MKKLVINYTTYVVKSVLYGLLGATLILLAGVVKFLNDKPDLEIWHTVDLDEAFTKKSEVTSFEEYLLLEERLFEQMDRLVYSQVEPGMSQSVNRYSKGSLSDPGVWDVQWNRTFELVKEKPACGVLLLHGLTDSPYSLRALGARLHAEGAYVIGLRIPGHGTVPSALAKVDWSDMSLAVKIAMRHLEERVGEAPLHLVGYSHGGALSVRYGLDAIDDPSLPQVETMALISPEIGITRLAGFGGWIERVGAVLGLDKVRWESVLPEYDPYKYNSFPLNAGLLAYQLTVENRKGILGHEKKGDLDQFPRVLAFQSIVDSTVSAPALVRDLFARLPQNDHELVIYDVNRSKQILAMLIESKIPEIARLEQSAERRYTLSLLTNEYSDARNVVLKTYAPNLDEPVVEELNLEWPQSVYSLSHVALPFRQDDPLYGANSAVNSGQIHLGALAVRGERGVSYISAGNMLRQRWNPFYDFQEARILALFNL